MRSELEVDGWLQAAHNNLRPKAAWLKREARKKMQPLKSDADYQGCNCVCVIHFTYRQYCRMS